MKPEITEAFAKWREEDGARSFSAVDHRIPMRDVMLYAEDAFAAGAEHGAKVEREDCAKHLEHLCNEHFQKLRDFSSNNETHICCDCMIHSLKSRAAELRARGKECRT